MSKRQRIVLFCMCVVAVGCFGGAALTTNTQPGLSDSHQLARLDPENLDGYLRVGEWLGANATTEQEQYLAVQTLAIGIGLAQRGGSPKVAASMCIALASVEPDPMMASSLWDLALLLDPARHRAWRIHRDTRSREFAKLRQDAARVVYAARFHDPELATELLGRRAVRETIRQGALRGELDPDRISRLLSKMINSALDDDCRGRVFITERDDGEVRRVVCREHSRPIGAGPDDESLRELIKLELVLLGELASPTNRDAWELVAYLETDEPVAEVSVSLIVAHYRVDLARPYWRGDRWASSP